MDTLVKDIHKGVAISEERKCKILLNQVSRLKEQFVNRKSAVNISLGKGNLEVKERFMNKLDRFVQDKKL